MTARPVGSVGLGGWLWPVTLLGPTLAVLAAALCVYGMRGIVVDLAPRVSHWPATFQVDGWFGSLAFAVLSAIAGTWSARWFDRDPVVPRRGPWVLAALAVGLSLLAWDTGDSILSLLLVAFAWLVALAAFLAARVSRRVHNPFTAAPLAPRASGWRGVLMHGPADWSNGRWWRVGVFGAESASKHYYGNSAAALSPSQAARLAVMLPKPRYYDKNRGSAYLQRRTETILKRMNSADLPK